MSKKLTIEFIRAEFAKEGYTLLTTVYENNKQKLEYKCSEKHKSSITWECWHLGQKCPYCANNVKLNIEFIRAEFAKEGYILLTKIYENAFQKLDYICSKGHKHFIIWNNWQQGKRCPYCYGKIKLTIEYIRKQFKKEGYTLLTKIYKGADQKLKYVCPKGHNHSISWDNWKAGHKCPTCAIIKNSGPTHYNWQGGISCEPYCQDWTKEFKDFIKERDGYKCQNPYCTSKNPDDLTIHHIDYNKKNCQRKNLITVCRSCNSRANTDRGWHKSWYQAILYRKYYNEENK